jgi:glycosyltransferase involved in cell wall biosynthesis
LNILFVEEVDWLKKVVYEIHSLPELLSSLGHNVFFIDFEEDWKRNHMYDFGTLKTKRSTVHGRAHPETSITLIRPGFIKYPFFDRLSALLTHYLEIERTIREDKIDAIMLYSCPTNGIQTAKLAKKYHIPVIYRSIDIQYMLVSNRSHVLVPNVILKLATLSIEKWVYRHMDKILTLSPKLSEYVKRMGADKDKVELLPFGVDMNKFNPNVHTEGLRKKLGITDDNKVILFIGTLFEFSGLDKYLKQFPKVLKEFPQARLIIVGGGILLETLKELVANLGLSKNVVLTGFQPFDMMPQYINLADICINPFVINSATRDIIPGKIIQYLACAKPVLATPLPGMVSLLSGLKRGVVYSDIDKFAESNIRLLKDSKLVRTIGENGYRYAKENHDEEKLTRRLERILRKMMSDEKNNN